MSSRSGSFYVPSLDSSGPGTDDALGVASAAGVGGSVGTPSFVTPVPEDLVGFGFSGIPVGDEAVLGP